MSKIKSILAFAALMLCGGAWAATPVAVWDGDFNIPTKNGYTIDVNGNTNNGKDITIPTTSRKGVKVTGSTDNRIYTILIKASGYAPSQAQTTEVIVSTLNGTTEFTGFGARNDNYAYGVWSGGQWTNNNGTLNRSTTANTAYSADTAHCYAVTYSYNDQGQAAQGTKLFFDGQVVASWRGLRGNTVDPAATAAVIGGPATQKDGLAAAKGMVIESIAIFGNDATDAEIQSYTWPVDATLPAIDYSKWENNPSVMTWNGTSTTFHNGPWKYFNLADGSDGAEVTTSNIPGQSANVGSIWNIFCAAGNSYDKYVAPGYVLRLTSEKSGNLDAQYNNFVLGGLIVEQGAKGYMFRSTGDRPTNLGNKTQDEDKKSLETWFEIRESVVFNREGAFTLHGPMNLNIAAGKVFDLNSERATTAAHQPTLDALTKATLIMRGDGNLKVGTLVANGDVTLDFSNLSLNRATPYIDGGLTLDESTHLVLPEGLEVEAEYVLCSGTLSAPALQFPTTIKVGNVTKKVRLTYNATNKSVSYVMDEAAYWTPNTAKKDADGIIDWTADDAWIVDGDEENPATWPTDGTGANLTVKLDAAMIGGVKITGAVSVKEVIVECSDKANHPFEFHNHTKGVEKDSETGKDPTTDKSVDCLTASVVNMGTYKGNLGLKVPIVGTINFGENTHLIFKTGAAGGDASNAYDYTIVGNTTAIEVDGNGKFQIPSTMYGIPFAPNANATIVYNEDGKTVTGTLSGAGKVAVETGTVTFGTKIGCAKGLAVDSGKAIISSLGEANKDYYAKPLSVASDAELEINQNDWFKYTGTFTINLAGKITANVRQSIGSNATLNLADGAIINGTSTDSAGDWEVYAGAADGKFVVANGATATINRLGIRGSNTVTVKGSNSTLKFTDSVYGTGKVTLTEGVTVNVAAGKTVAFSDASDGKFIKTTAHDDGSTSYELKTLVAVYNEQNYATIQEAIDAANGNLSSIVILDGDAVIPTGYAKMTKGEVTSIREIGDVYYVSGSLYNQTGDDEYDCVIQTADGWNTPFVSGDTLVIDNHTSENGGYWKATTVYNKVRIAKNFELYPGVDNEVVGAGVEFTIDSNCTLTFKKNETWPHTFTIGTATIKGSGELIYEAYETANVPGFTLDNSWTGLITIKNFGSIGGVSGKNQNVTWTNLNDLFSKVGNKVKFVGVCGYYTGTKTDCDLILENGGTGREWGWRNDNGSSSDSATFKSISGSGKFKDTFSCTQNMVFKDASNFTGTIEAYSSGKKYTLGAESMHASAQNGTIYVDGNIKGGATFSGSTVIANGITIDITNGPITASSVTFGSTLATSGAELTVGTPIVNVANFTGTLPSIVGSDLELEFSNGAIRVAPASVTEMSASALNTAQLMRIRGNATLNVDTDITGTPAIVNASGSAVTLTLKAVAPKTYVSAADIKKLQLGTNITLAYDWEVAAKVVSINFHPGANNNTGTMPDTTDLVMTMAGKVSNKSWNNMTEGTSTTARNVTKLYNPSKDGDDKSETISGLTATYTGRAYYSANNTNNANPPFMKGYIDDNASNKVRILLSGVPFSKYDIIVYMQGDTTSHSFCPIEIINGSDVTGVTYGYNNDMQVVSTGYTASWGGANQTAFSYEKNVIRICGVTGSSVTIASTLGGGSSRGTIAAIQIVDSSDQTVANPTGQYRPDTGAVGCFSGWGDSTADNNKTVGPFGVGVIQRLSSTWHPYASNLNLATMGENNEFTLGLYANIEQVKPATGKHAVLWSMGDFWNAGNRYILAKESNGDVKLYLSETEKLTIPASKIGAGYHLFTMVFSATSGTKLILDDYLDAIYEDTELKGVQAAGGFQVGQGYGTNPTDFETGTDMGVAVVIAYQVALNAEQLEEYVLRYPVSTTFSVNVDVDTNNQVVYMPSMTALAATYIGGSKGTLTIPEGATVSVPSICTINNNNSGDRFTMNIAGTVEVTSTTANAVIYGQHKSKGILFGHYHGQGTYNITGTLNAPNTGIETVYTAEMQTIDLNGGTINTKAFYAGKLNNTTINLSNSATINLSLEGADQNVPFTNVSDANKIAATGSMTFSQAITLTAGTLEFDVAAGKTVTISGAVSGEGKILKKVNGKGELVFTGDVASGIVADVTDLLPGEEYVVAKGAFDAETVAKCEVIGGEGWSIVNRGSHIAVRHQIAKVGETPCYTIVDIATAVAAGGTTITITSDSLAFRDGSFVLNGTPVEGISATDNGNGTYEVVVTYESADEHNLVISEICPKTTAWDENHKDAGWLELHNTGSTWVNFGKYTLGRYNRGKAVKATEWTNGVTLSIAPGARLVIKTSEDYSAKSKKTIVQYGEDLGNAIVFDSKVNPKKYPLVVLIKGGKVVQNCVVPVDVPENKSVCYDGELKNGAIASYITTASKGEASNFEGAVAVGPQISPLYAVKDAVDPWQKFPKATIGEAYPITVPVNPIMDGNTKNEIASVKLIYRIDFGAEVVVETPMTKSETKDAKNGYTYTGEIPGSAITTAGQLVRWAVQITDVGGNVWRAPSFNNGDDGYEYFGTIVTPSEEQLSGGLNTWHLFADPEEVADGIGTENMKPNALMNKDADESGFTTTLHPNGGRVGIYDMETGLYYDNVRIDKRGRTTGAFTKKAHGLKFSKSQPFTGTDSLTGEKIECRKSSITAEYGDPTFIRQELAFEVMRRNGVKAPFHYPVRLNLNGQFYQLAFHSERFSDELIEDFYGLDGKGYAYKNVGTFHNGTNNSSERKTPDDGSPDLTTNDPVLKAFCDTLNGVNNIGESTDFAANPTYSADVSKVVTRSFDLPAWINYMAATKITAETDDTWANLSAYYDINGTGTWMPLAYDMNQSLGQWHFADDRARGRIGLVADIDNFKSHPFYGGLHIRMHNNAGNASGNPNYAYEAIFQSEKFRRLFLRRLRTIMDKEIGATVYADQASEKSALFTSAAAMVAKINELGLEDRKIWTDYANVDFANNTDRSTNGSCDKIWVWPQSMTEQLGTPQGGLADLWTNYVKPRRAYLYGKHLASNGTVDVGYGLNLSAGIPAEQTDIATLKGTDENPKITARYDATLGTVIIENDNDETIDLSGWKLTGPVTMTIPEGTVLDRKVGEMKGQVYLTANRKATIAAFGANLADQVIVGNGAANGTETPISLRTDAGVRVVGEPTAQELNIRFDAFYGATLGDGDENEWFSIKNIGEESVDYTGMTVCILKDGDGEEKDHCHVTLPEGTLEAGVSKKFVKDDFATGFVKIQNNTVNISVYDLYMSPIQKMQVTQKDYTWAYLHGAYLEHQTDSGKWHQVWDSGDLVLADYLSDKGKNVKALAKDLYVRAAAPMTITLDNPSFDASSTLKISGEGTVTITGTLNAKVNTTAIKSTGNLVFTDGSYTITAGDDCIQADGDITINGGTFICHSTGNDGIDANQNIVINGGTIFAFTAANEALDGADPQYSTGLDVNTGHTITINGGTIIATSATSDALNALDVKGSQAAKVVAVTGLTAEEAKTIAIADILVPFPAMATAPTAVLVSTPHLKADVDVEVEEETPGTVEIVAGNVETDTAAVHATVPASWKSHAAVTAGTITEKQAAEAFVLGLAEPTEKPMVSSEQTTETDSIRIVDNVAPRFGTGVTVKRTLFVGTTPGEESANTSIEETNGGFTVPLPTEGEKVKYIKIKYSFK